jgi:hypothetical protein
MINLDCLKESFFLWQTDLSVLEGIELTEAAQTAVLAATLSSPTCDNFPPRLDFRLAFCKKLIKAAEAAGETVAEELYDKLLQLQQEHAAAPGYKTYVLHNIHVSLRETHEIIR